MEEKGIDLLFAFGNEAEPQYQKYFSNYWPSFETAAVMIGRKGGAVLLVGPESEDRARELGIIKNIKRLNAFRESASPAYHDNSFSTLSEVIEECLGENPLKKASIAGSRILPFDVYEELKQSIAGFGQVEMVFDSVIDTLRSKKSADEVACIKRACDITTEALSHLIRSMHVGMTELQAKGIALSKMY